MIRLALALALALSATGCPPTTSIDDDDASDDDDPTQAHLTVTNDAEVLWTLIEAGECGTEPGESVEIAVPPGGLSPGASITQDLAPGCWTLTAEGNGCFAADQNPRELAADDSSEWTIVEDDVVCQGR